MISINTLGRWAATALLTVGLAGGALAQEHGEGGGDPVEELKKALEQMRSAEELLAQSSREQAAVAQDDVDKILRKLLDDIELSQDGAAKKMLLGAEKAAVKIDDHIQRVIDMAKFSQGQGQGQGMEPKGQPQGGEQPKDGQMRGKDESQGQKQQKPGQDQAGKQQGKQDQQQSGSKPGSSQADRAYEAKSGKGRPAGAEEDPNAWTSNLPSKFQEDALKEAPASWPGKYENLIRRWQKTLARLPSRR